MMIGVVIYSFILLTFGSNAQGLGAVGKNVLIDSSECGINVDDVAEHDSLQTP
jgi:hypothetical protein